MFRPLTTAATGPRTLPSAPPRSAATPTAPDPSTVSASSRASQAIAPGSHIHTQNLAFEELALHYEFPVGETPYPQPPRNMPTFLGYVREDGRVGTRNYIAVVAASNCAAHTA